MEDDGWPWQDLLLRHPKRQKKLRVKILGPCCWYASAGQVLMRVVLVRDPEGTWRDETLLSTDPGLSAEEVIVGYLGRWRVEVAYCQGKQLLGFHDPMVWSPAGVARAHPLSWFVGSLVVLWYAQVGRGEEPARRERPWYEEKAEPTMSDILACCRRHLWVNWLNAQPQPEERERRVLWLVNYLSTAA